MPAVFYGQERQDESQDNLKYENVRKHPEMATLSVKWLNSEIAY